MINKFDRLFMYLLLSSHLSMNSESGIDGPFRAREGEGEGGDSRIELGGSMDTVVITYKRLTLMDWFKKFDFWRGFWFSICI